MNNLGSLSRNVRIFGSLRGASKEGAVILQEDGNDEHGNGVEDVQEEGKSTNLTGTHPAIIPSIFFEVKYIEIAHHDFNNEEFILDD